MEHVSGPCPLCGQGGAPRRLPEWGARLYVNCWCGSYYVTCSDAEDYLDGTGRGRLDEDRRHRLSVLVRELDPREDRLVRPLLRFKKDAEYPLLPQALEVDVGDLLTRWPSSVPQQLDRALQNIERLTTRPGHVVRIGDAGELFCPLLFARDQREAQYIRDALRERSLIESGLPAQEEVRITPKGWQRLGELEVDRGSSQNPAFVAMWFGAPDQRHQADATWTAIQGGCALAGWRAIKSDSEPHNDFIMDKILGDIRKAPFVVADFTGHRNGVYIEAGFARGMGKPVIHTCRADHFANAHFDIKQINTIKWTEPEELREGVLHRIRATIGEGPQPLPPDLDQPLA